MEENLTESKICDLKAAIEESPSDYFTFIYDSKVSETSVKGIVPVDDSTKIFSSCGTE